MEISPIILETVTPRQTILTRPQLKAKLSRYLSTALTAAVNKVKHRAGPTPHIHIQRAMFLLNRHRVYLPSYLKIIF